MISRKYSAEFKINAVKEYLKSGLTPTEFALNKNIPDSTFFDWIKKYKKDESGFCNVTNEIKKIMDVEIIENMSVSQTPTTPLQNKAKGFARMAFNGTMIEFDEALLPKVLEVISKW